MIHAHGYVARRPWDLTILYRCHVRFSDSPVSGRREAGLTLSWQVVSKSLAERAVLLHRIPHLRIDPICRCRQGWPPYEDEELTDRETC
jgi:hypothetical protein